MGPRTHPIWVLEATIHGQLEDEDPIATEVSTEEIKECAQKCQEMCDCLAKTYSDEGLIPRPTDFDVFKDLMRLNPDKVYKKLELFDLEHKQYGLISGSKGCISFLLAAPFCEWVNFAANM